VKRSSSLFSLLLVLPPSVSLSRDRFTAFYTAIVFAEQPRYYMLKIIFYLGTSLTANLDAAPRRIPGIPGLALGRNSPALLSSPRMREERVFDEFHSGVLLGRPTFSRTE